MLRERLKEMELRITELADYLQVSRPTMYKFIDCYDLGKFGAINKDVLRLFNYITENELAGKKSVINYILSELNAIQITDTDNETVKAVKNYLLANPESKKSMFIAECFLNEEFNDVICYLASISRLLKKQRLTAADKVKMQPYYNLKKEIKPMEENK